MLASGVGNSNDSNADSWRLNSWSGAINNILQIAEILRLTWQQMVLAL